MQRIRLKDVLLRLLGIPPAQRRFDHSQCFDKEVREWISRNKRRAT